MGQIRKLAVCSAWILLCLTSHLLAQSAGSTRHLITEDAIASILQHQGIRCSASQVHLPMRLESNSAVPSLEIASVDKATAGVLRVRFRCREVGDCLSFDAQIIGLKDPEIQAAYKLFSEASRQGILHGDNPQPEAQSGLRASAFRPVFASGSALTLIVQDPRMTIHLPVVAMDRGVVGRSVRVCTPDHKNVFHAVVLDGSTVRGEIE